MKHFLLSTILIFIRSLAIQAQTDSTTKVAKHKHYKIIVFKQWGMPDFGYDSMYLACERTLQTQYGFEYQIVGGCVLPPGKLQKWERYNRKMEKKMMKRHGKDWREQYEKSLKVCWTK